MKISTGLNIIGMLLLLMAIILLSQIYMLLK